MREPLTRERLLELLDFDETISRFRWKERPGKKDINIQFAGKFAGSERRRGKLTYRQVMIGGKDYLEHRLVWLYYYGHFPKEALDHLDGDGLHNAKENLRLAPGNFNYKSMAKRVDNTSGHTGVSWNKARNKWRVQVRHNGTDHHGGYFKKDDLLLAITKAAEMRKAFGFSPTHGLSREERKLPYR